MFDYLEALPAGEQERIQQIIQKLYRQTFLLERKFDKKEGRMISNKDYYDCEKHMGFLTEYLKVAGISLFENRELGVIYIQGEPAMGERLYKLATIYILLFKLLFDEKMSKASASVTAVTTLGELNAKAGTFRLLSSLSSPAEMRKALNTLKKYQLIEVLDPMDELSEHTQILIFPSINVVLAREDIVRLLKTFSAEEGETEDDE